MSLLEKGKAVACWGQDETFYIQLKFDPKSAIVVPESDGKLVPVKDDMDVWKLIPPKRNYIEKLVKVAKSNECCRRNISRDDWNYLKALLMTRWKEIKSPMVLKSLAPIAKAFLKGLAGIEIPRIQTHPKADPSRERRSREG